MKPGTRNSLIGCFGVAVAVLLLLLFASPYIWLRSAGTVVKLNGQPTTHAAVYRSSGGKLVVWIRERSIEVPYIIYTSGRYVVIPNDNFLRTAGFALNKEKRPSGVGINAPKCDLNGNLPPVFTAAYVEFTSMSSHRVRVEL
jgi:hypothetical protein